MVIPDGNWGCRAVAHTAHRGRIGCSGAAGFQDKVDRMKRIQLAPTRFLPEAKLPILA